MDYVRVTAASGLEGGCEDGLNHNSISASEAG